MSNAEVPPRLRDKKVAITGTFQLGSRGEIEKLIAAEGGAFAKTVTKDTDYVVIGATRGKGKSTAEKQADKHNKNGSAIIVLDEDRFKDLLTPDADDAIALLTSGKEGVERFNRVCGKLWNSVRVDLTGADLRKAELSNADLTCVDLTGADLREATVDHTHFDHLRDVRFDKATLTHAHIRSATDCSFRDASMQHVWCDSAMRCNFDNADAAHTYIDELTDCTAKKSNFDEGHVSKLTDVDLTGASLRDIHSYAFDAKGCKFTRTDMSRSSFGRAAFADCDFAGATLTDTELSGAKLPNAKLPNVKAGNARLEAAVLTGADLSKADLTGADLAGAKLVKADLSKAKLVNANLATADLSDATVKGADFTGANINGVLADGIDTDAAKGFDPTQSTGGSIGANILAVEKVSQQAEELKLHAAVEMPDGKRILLELNTYSSRYGSGCHGYQYEEGASRYGNIVQGNNLSGLIATMGKKWGHGTLQFDAIKTTSKKSPTKGKELREIAVAAWCEAFDVEVPTAKQLKAAQSGTREDQQKLRDEHVALLRSGAKGVKEWNAMPAAKRKRPKHHRKADLSGAKLKGADLSHMDFQNADFTGADLSRARLDEADLKGACFKGATLKSVKAEWGAKLNDADFDNADLTSAKIYSTNMLRTSFRGATFNKTTLNACDVSGANLSDAIGLDKAKFYNVKYDENTTFPDGFIPPDGFLWNGTGNDPRIKEKVEAVVKEKRAAGPIDIETFMQDLENRTDKSRLDKALKMLKKSGFQLYVDVHDDHFVGVVKSQTDASLVYACRLDHEGSFTCCTQNLNVCGGLRGALCKHLLVLIIGLTKAGELDPQTIDEWVEMSRHNSPKLDKDAMGDVFLKYKGAEAGEVDWRPTETLPEDYYAF